MGDLWLHEEESRRRIIEAFPHNKIISFPQSIFFNTEEQKKVSSEIYSQHPNLMIATRDDKSYALAQQLFPHNTVIRAEDIVMFYDYPMPFLPANDSVLFIMRDDAEKRTGSGIEELKTVAETEFDVQVTDTTVPELFFTNIEHGAKLVYRKVDQCHAAKLVVTDRLHGAVFALHAGKPVIVFENSYGKISGALKTLIGRLPERVFFADATGSNVNLDVLRDMYSLGESNQKLSFLLEPEIHGFASQIEKFIHS